MCITDRGLDRPLSGTFQAVSESREILLLNTLALS